MGRFQRLGEVGEHGAHRGQAFVAGEGGGRLDRGEATEAGDAHAKHWGRVVSPERGIPGVVRGARRVRYWMARTMKSSSTSQPVAHECPATKALAQAVTTPRVAVSVHPGL